MDEADQGPTPQELAEREREEKERKAKEAAEQAALPYKWTQTIRDVDVVVPVPGNVRGRDLEVVMTKTKLKVAVRGQQPILEVGAHTNIHTLSLLADVLVLGRGTTKQFLARVIFHIR